MTAPKPVSSSGGRRALVEVATQLLVAGGLPEHLARDYATSSLDLQDAALPVAAVCQRLLREAQAPINKLNALLAESGTSLAEFATRLTTPAQQPDTFSMTKHARTPS